MRRIFLLIAIAGFIVSCDPNNSILDDNYAEGNSTIVATVFNNNNPIGSGVKVVTDPFTYELTTDHYGQVKFENLPNGEFNVYAYLSSFGSGKATVELNDNLQNAEIHFKEGVLIEPYVNIISPENNQGFTGNQEIEFIANVRDNNTSIEDLQYEWESNIDGILSGGTISTDGQISLLTSSLSASEHYIKLIVTNQLGISSSDSVFINTLSPNSLNISVAQDEKYHVTIAWDTPDNEVDSIKVYRSTIASNYFELIGSLPASASSCIDQQVPFADSVYYLVSSINTSGYSSVSNLVATKGVPVFSIAPNQAEMLPNSSIIYFRQGNSIIGFDYETLSITIEEAFDGSIGYFHVGNNGFGNELYLPNSDGWLYIYDLATFKQKEMINVGCPVECVISNNNGLLFTSVSPSPWWEDPLRIYKRSTLSFVDGGGDFDDTRLKLLPSGNEIIEISTSISPTDMDYYLLDENGNIVTHKNDSYHGDHPLNANIFKISPLNNYLVTSNQGAVYNANSSMTFIGTLPRGSETFSDFEFNSSATTIYAGLSSKKAIYLYDYQSLLKTGEIKTKGYPIFLFRKNNELIVVSSPTQVSYYNPASKIGIEVYPL